MTPTNLQAACKHWYSSSWQLEYLKAQHIYEYINNHNSHCLHNYSNFLTYIFPIWLIPQTCRQNLHVCLNVTPHIAISNQCHQKVGSCILRVFHEQPCYEVLSQDAGVAKELLIKGIVHSWHVGQRLLLVVSQEGRGATQTARRDRD